MRWIDLPIDEIRAIIHDPTSAAERDVLVGHRRRLDRQASRLAARVADVDHDVTRQTDEADYSGFVFSKYGEHDFFLLHLLGDPTDADRLSARPLRLARRGPQRGARALAAGASEMTPPRDAQGMPRCSAIKDPSGNWVWLYQG